MPDRIYLSPEAKNLLSLMCNEYYARIANGESPTDAKAFGGGEQLIKDFKLECSLTEIGKWCEELSGFRLINAVFIREDELIGAYLYRDGIEYIGNKK